MSLVDTHCHLDAANFDKDREKVLADAIASGVHMMLLPSVRPKNYIDVIKLALNNPHCCYALGMHPMYVDDLLFRDVPELSNVVSKTLMVSNKLVAVGEIGLDFYHSRDNEEQQVHFFTEQLKIAKENHLPVILHVRKAIDDVLKYLRQYQVKGGIAHAFNGSMQQAEAFIELGFKLGFGGAMTYPRAAKIRALAKSLPLESIVLETDSPDIPPEWVGNGGRNSPVELKKIAEVLADIRGIPLSQIIEITSKNSMDVLPKLGDLCTRLEVIH